MDSHLQHIYHDSNISFAEQLIINKILKNYYLDVANVQKIRSVYKVTTSSESYCLKKIGNGEKRAIKSISIMEYLVKRNFHNVARPVYSISGEIIVKINNSAYYLTNWIDGEEIDFQNPDHIFEATKLLAKFHESAKGFYIKKIKLTSNMGRLPKIYRKQLYLMKMFKKHIENKSEKSNFDMEYYKNIDRHILEAEKAINFIRNSDYFSICEANRDEMYICHNSFYYQNILKDTYDNYFIVDLESCLYDLPIVDLGKLIRRIMYRKKFFWDFDFFKAIIDKYLNERQILQNEYEILLSILIFPYKYYRLGRKRYLKKKKWKEERYIEKLNKLLKSTEKKEMFITKFKKHYNITL